MELSHQREHQRNNIDPEIKVYPLASLEDKVQMNGWQLAGFVALGLLIAAVLSLTGLRT